MRDASFAKPVLNRAPAAEPGRPGTEHATDHDSEYLALRRDFAAELARLVNHAARPKTRA